MACADGYLPISKNIWTAGQHVAKDGNRNKSDKRVRSFLITVLFQLESSCLDEKNLRDHLQGISDCIRVLQARMEERMDQIESKMYEQCTATALGVESLQSSLRAGSERTDTKVERVSSRLDTRCDTVEKKLDKIAYAVGIRYVVSAGDDNEDRKRLKMRLKEALKMQHTDSDGRVIENEKEGYLEYIFGIRAPNSRIGKQGSRSPRTPYYCYFNNNMVHNKLALLK